MTAMDSYTDEAIAIAVAACNHVTHHVIQIRKQTTKSHSCCSKISTAARYAFIPETCAAIFATTKDEFVKVTITFGV